MLHNVSYSMLEVPTVSAFRNHHTSELGHRQVWHAGEIRELCTTRSLGVLQLTTLTWTGRKVQ